MSSKDLISEIDSRVDRPCPLSIQDSPGKMRAIGDEILHLLDEAEMKISQFSRQLDEKIASVESTATLTLNEFHAYLHEGNIWMDQLIENLDRAGNETHTLIDTTKVNFHLAVMESKEAMEELRIRLDRFKGELDNLVKRTEKSTSDRLALMSFNTRNIIDALSKTKNIFSDHRPNY